MAGSVAAGVGDRAALLHPRPVDPELPPGLQFGEAETRQLARWYTRAARLYALLVLIALGLGEWIAVEVLAEGSSTTADLKNTAGSLAAGFTALIVTARAGTKRAAG